MNSLEVKSLTGRQICDIIKACAESGVRELKLGEMHIQFGGEKTSIVGTQATFEGTQTPSQESGTTEQEINTEQDKSFMDAIQARTAEDVMQSQTLMDDPSGFEREIVSSFLYEGDGVDVTEESRRVKQAL